MTIYANSAIIAFRFLAVLILISGLPTLISGTPQIALATAIAATALYMLSRPLGAAITRDLK